MGFFFKCLLFKHDAWKGLNMTQQLCTEIHSFRQIIMSEGSMVKTLGLFSII